VTTLTDLKKALVSITAVKKRLKNSSSSLLFLASSCHINAVQLRLMLQFYVPGNRREKNVSVYKSYTVYIFKLKFSVHMPPITYLIAELQEISLPFILSHL